MYSSLYSKETQFVESFLLSSTDDVIQDLEGANACGAAAAKHTETVQRLLSYQDTVGFKQFKHHSALKNTQAIAHVQVKRLLTCGRNNGAASKLISFPNEAIYFENE